ncbi:MAG TPA: hypothetical protein G4O11_01305 [Anaerolineae bacterium]|nr:hypothetical protein [Anaerolineae bacterium]
MRGRLWIFLVLLIIITIACGRGTPSLETSDETPIPTSPPTVTPYPIPPPPANQPSALPDDSELRELIRYANEMYPLLVDAGTLLQRDGEILKESEGGKDEVLCDGRLAADNASMKNTVHNVRSISPPEEAEAIHDLVLRSGDAWTEALDNVERFCDTGNQFYKIPAVLKFWEAAATLQDTGNRFWLLIMSKGVEDWVRR